MKRTAGGRAGLVLLAALLAAVLDGTSAGAAIYLERCASSGNPLAAATMALQLPAHVRAFPWTTAAMLAWCLPWRHQGARPAAVMATLRRLCLMPLVMVPACLAAWQLASAAPGNARAQVFVFAMLTVSIAGETALARLGRARKVPPGARQHAQADAADGRRMTPL